MWELVDSSLGERVGAVPSLERERQRDDVASGSRV